jgi:hypothetical protein
MSEHQAIEHLDGPYERWGRCLRRCGRTARYVEIDHDQETFRGDCPVCGTYPASATEVEDACD